MAMFSAYRAAFDEFFDAPVKFAELLQSQRMKFYLVFHLQPRHFHCIVIGDVFGNRSVFALLDSLENLFLLGTFFQ